MKLKQYTRCIELRKGESRFAFLPSGDVRSFTQGDYLVNGFLGTQKEGSANNIWLRVYDGEGCRSYPLLGIRSGSRVSFSASPARRMTSITPDHRQSIPAMDRASSTAAPAPSTAAAETSGIRPVARPHSTAAAVITVQITAIAMIPPPSPHLYAPLPGTCRSAGKFT